MSAVDGPTRTTVVQFANMDQALAAGDLEAVMVMLGIERASTAEEVVKTKIETIRANNARIQELNKILQKIQGKDDKEGTRLGLTLEEVAAKHTIQGGLTMKNAFNAQELADILAFVRSIDDQTLTIPNDTDEFIQ